jgi:hypothetical protein
MPLAAFYASNTHGINTGYFLALHITRGNFCDKLNLPKNPETDMLSPHEFATLLLVKAAPDQIDLDRAELDTLLEYQLVALEQLASGVRRPRLTRVGDSVLQAVDRKP